MSKKHFIALADAIRSLSVFTFSNQGASNVVVPMFRYQDVVDSLANFCVSQNGNFNRQRWLDYIAGECGPNGGAIRK